MGKILHVRVSERFWAAIMRACEAEGGRSYGSLVRQHTMSGIRQDAHIDDAEMTAIRRDHEGEGDAKDGEGGAT
jgi:hypothetical protein